MDEEFFDGLEPDDVDPALRGRIDEVMEDVMRDMSRIGLHADQVVLMQNQSDGRQFMLSGTFVIGDLALSDSVQKPDVVDDRLALEALERDLMLDNLKQLQRRFSEGEAE